MNKDRDALIDSLSLGRSERCCATVASTAPAPAPSSRRRRLWELGPHAHCPVIGVSLPMAALRRLTRKVLREEPPSEDYELHCYLIGECKRRTRLAEEVQRELDRRFMLPLRHAANAKSADALAAWWQTQEHASMDLPGALWATLTHPRCTPAIEHHAIGQIHMLQHQLGMATRADLSRFEALIDENAVLARAIAAAQQRCTRQAAEHAARTESLQAQAVRLNGQRLAADSSLALLQEDMRKLREAMPDLEGRMALAQRVAQLNERTALLQRQLQQARGEIDRLTSAPAQTAESPSTATSPDTEPAIARPEVALVDRAVLCVGGRAASVPVYRRLVENRGGRFLHHDGGEENGANQLEATLAAADLVICQTGCVSHNAYWRVKDHCKRTGKRCVFVETPSAASLQRALAEMPGGA